MLHIHGGGFVSLGAQAELFRSQALASALNCVVVSVDYRLSRETHFPGPFDDVYAALKWLTSMLRSSVSIEAVSPCMAPAPEEVSQRC